MNWIWCKLPVMRRVIGVFLIWPMLCFSQQGQYADTIKGKLTINYNQPLRMKVSLLAGGAFETQGLEGSVMLPAAFVDVHVRPSKWFAFHGALSNQFQLGWQYQKIIDTRNLEFGGRFFFKRKTIDKIKTFTAGTAAWNYDFHFPVKILWNMGITGSYRFGTGVFNSGLDPNTPIRFRNIETGRINFHEQFAVPYTFSEVQAGFVLNTSSSMRLTAHLPYGQKRARRMKTFTEFRVEIIFGNQFRADSMISVKPSDQAFHNDNYGVIIGDINHWGYRVSGFFRRKIFGFKIEAGARPGINYRFSASEQNSILNRTYLLFGVGFGWM